MKRALLVIMLGALYILHQDSWFWRTANPLVFGFLPIGLFYHACYTIAIAFALWLLVEHAWPSELEDGVSDGETVRGGETATYRPVAESHGRPLSSTEEGAKH